MLSPSTSSLAQASVGPCRLGCCIRYRDIAANSVYACSAERDVFPVLAHKVPPHLALVVSLLPVLGHTLAYAIHTLPSAAVRPVAVARPLPRSRSDPWNRAAPARLQNSGDSAATSTTYVRRYRQGVPHGPLSLTGPCGSQLGERRAPGTRPPNPPQRCVLVRLLFVPPGSFLRECSTRLL